MKLHVFERISEGHWVDDTFFLDGEEIQREKLYSYLNILERNGRAIFLLETRPRFRLVLDLEE